MTEQNHWSEWTALWKLLPEEGPNGKAKRAPAPLILAAWHETSDAEKQERLAEHIRLAESGGVLVKAATYLKSLGSEDWYYGI